MDQNRVRRRANINTVTHFCDLLTVVYVGLYLLQKDKFEYKVICTYPTNTYVGTLYETSVAILSTKVTTM
jgi:hypothetical protein